MARIPWLQVQPHVLLSLVLYKLVNPVQARHSMLSSRIALALPSSHSCEVLAIKDLRLSAS